MGRGTAALPAITTLGAVGFLALIFDAATASVSMNDLLGGVILALVLLLLKKTFDIDKALAGALPQIKTHSEEIHALRESKHEHANALSILMTERDLRREAP